MTSSTRGLGKAQHFQGTERYVVDQRAAARRFEWEQQWQRKREIAEKRRAQEEARAKRSKDKQAQRDFVESRSTSSWQTDRSNCHQSGEQPRGS